MKTLAIILLLVATTFAVDHDAERKAIVDFVLNRLGLREVWATIQQAGSNLVSQFQSILTQLLFASQQAWNQVTPIFSQLVADLTSHAGDAVPLVTNAIRDLTSILGQFNGKRNAEEKIVDFLINTFGLGPVWQTIQEVGANLLEQFQAQLSQLLWAGQNAWSQARPIFTELISQLQAHAGDAVPLITTAIQSLTQVLNPNGKRDLEDKAIIDFILNTLNIRDVWQTIQQVGGNLVQQLQGQLQQLIFAGQQVWAQIPPIIRQLAADLQAHAGDAAPLIQEAVRRLTALLQSSGKRDIIADKDLFDFILNQFGLLDIWQTVQQLGGNLVGQLQAQLSQALFAGSQVWEQIRVLFGELATQLQQHAGDAIPLVTQAIRDLTQILNPTGKRDVEKNLIDGLLSIFDLGSVWSTIQQVGLNFSNQIRSIITQLLFAGQQVIDQAKPIFSQLVADLQSHTGDAVGIIRDAIRRLNQVLAGTVPTTKADEKFINQFLSNLFNIGDVWDTVQNVASQIGENFSGLLTNLVFAGQNVLNQARPIFTQLVSDLHSHIDDAKPIVQEAIRQLTAIIQSAGKRDVVDFIVNAFNLGPIWQTVQQAGANLVGRFTAALQQLLFAGTTAWEQAKPIFSQLFSDLQTHIGDAGTYVQIAITRLNELLSSSIGGK